MKSYCLFDAVKIQHSVAISVLQNSIMHSATPITIIFLLFVSIAQSQEIDNLLLHDLKTENDEYTYKDSLCSNSNVSLSFSDLNLNELKQNFISSPMITCLDLNGNQIHTIYPHAFVNLPNLKYLDLSNNNFNSFGLLKDSFLELETLILNGCDGNSYYGEVIEGYYPKLKKLFLKNNNNLRRIQSQQDNLPSLTHLFLSENMIRENDFSWLPNSLQYLDLTRNDLYSLKLTNLTNLEKLLIDDQRNNDLTKINLENLISLKHLSIKSNKIDSVVFSTFKNTRSLIYLDISDNNIKYIESGSLDSMKNLQFLNLSNNYLEMIQVGTFDQMSDLRTLSLEKNVISIFPMIGKEIKLQSLLLNCNSIRSIVGGTFAKMPYLESLFLHDNEISFIDQEAFSGLTNLKILTLSNNKLTALPHNWMTPLVSLNTMDLIGNSFISLSDLSLSESSGLQNLYLSKQLEYINAQALFAIPDNVTIDLRDDFTFVEQCVKDSYKYNHEYYG